MNDRIHASLKALLEIGILAVLVISPTQYAMEVIEKVYVCAVDPLIWGVFMLLMICTLLRLVRPRMPSLFAVLFLAAVGLSAIRASNRMSTMKELFQTAEYFIVAYMLFAVLISDSKRRTQALYLFTGVGTLIVALGLIQYLRPSISILDVRGTFGNRNVLGGYLALLVPLLTGLMLYEKNPYRLIWYALTIVAALFINLSGGAILGILAAIGIVAMFRGWIPFTTLAVLLILAVFVILPHLPRDNAAELGNSIQLFDEDANVSRRYTEWQAAASMVAENPIVGVGAGNYQDNIGMYYGILPDPIGPTEPDTQNLYMVTASSTGLFGLLSLLGILCYSAVSALRQYCCADSDFESGIQVGILGSIIAFTIAAIWSPLLVRGISIPLVFILTLASIGRKPKPSNTTA